MKLLQPLQASQQLSPTTANLPFPVIPTDPANSMEHWQGFDSLQTLKPTGHHPRDRVSLAELEGLKAPALELHLLRFWWCPYSGLCKPKPPECEDNDFIWEKGLGRWNEVKVLNWKSSVI